jgi:hypothetical protein
MNPFSLDHIFPSVTVPRDISRYPVSYLRRNNVLRHTCHARSRSTSPVPMDWQNASFTSAALFAHASAPSDSCGFPFPRVVKEQLGRGDTRRSWAWLELN